MLLLIDIGNSNITIGFYDGGIKNILRLKTDLKIKNIMDELKDFILKHRMKKPEDAIMCSVVPRVSPLLSGALKKSFGFMPLNVGHNLRLGLKFRMKNHAHLGADRIANAVAAHTLYYGHLIVVDFGTATTFCLISSNGEYKGGSIMPGIGISKDVLAEKTAKLPKVRLKAPAKALGGNTESNILSGLFFGHAGAVERIIREIKHELANRMKNKNKIPICVIATGGFANLIAPYIKGIKKINPELTLHGLKIIYKLNR